MSIKEQVVQQLESLTEAEIKKVAEYMDFLRFQTRVRPIPVFNEEHLSTLYAEFADEDRELAEEGMQDYAEGLVKKAGQRS